MTEIVATRTLRRGLRHQGWVLRDDDLWFYVATRWTHRGALRAIVEFRVRVGA